MARVALGLSPIRFTPPRAPNETPVRIDPGTGYRRERRASPIFALAAGTLDRPLQRRSPFGSAMSLLAHASVLVLILAMLPKYTTIALPQVPDMWAFVVPSIPEPAPPPGPPPPKIKHEAPEPEPPKQAVEEAQLAIPLEATAGIAPETGLMPSTPMSASGFGVEGGVSWGTGTGSSILADIPTPPPAPPAPEVIEPIRVGGDVTEPALLVRVNPSYPGIAAKAMMEGIVILEATVNEEGDVESVAVLRSRGVLLDKAARDAVMQWRYSPLVYHGRPHPFILTVTVTFSLTRPES